MDINPLFEAGCVIMAVKKFSSGRYDTFNVTRIL